MDWVKKGCDDCRQGALSGMYSPEAAAKFQLPVEPPTFVYTSIEAGVHLYRCNECGAWWEFNQREAHVISESAAKDISPALDADGP
jgi:hypothetical protein